MILDLINNALNKFVEWGVYAPMWQLKAGMIGAGVVVILICWRPRFRFPVLRLPSFRTEKKRVLHIKVISV